MYGAKNKAPSVRILNESPTFFKHFLEKNVCKFAKPHVALNGSKHLPKAGFFEYLSESATELIQTYMSN